MGEFVVDVAHNQSLIVLRTPPGTRTSWRRRSTATVSPASSGRSPATTPSCSWSPTLSRPTTSPPSSPNLPGFDHERYCEHGRTCRRAATGAAQERGTSEMRAQGSRRRAQARQSMTNALCWHTRAGWTRRSGAVDARAVGLRSGVHRRRRGPDARGRTRRDPCARANAAGAIVVEIIDAARRFADGFLAEAIRANSMYEGKYPLVSALSRPIIVEHLVDVRAGTVPTRSDTAVLVRVTIRCASRCRRASLLPTSTSSRRRACGV